MKLLQTELKSRVDHSRAMIHSSSSLINPFLDPLHPKPRTPSLLFPSHRDSLRDPRPGALFGRFAEQPPSTGYEPNDLPEENNSEVAPTLFQGGSACSASTCNSREDIDTTPVESETDDAQNMGMSASPLYTQDREASGAEGHD